MHGNDAILLYDAKGKKVKIEKIIEHSVELFLKPNLALDLYENL